jgi:hypothetical protein
VTGFGRRGATLAISLALLLGACGSSSTGDKVADAGASLGRVRSGEMRLRLELTAGSGDQAKGGFELAGLFDLQPGDGGLQRADLTQQRFGTGEKAVRVVSDGTRAFIVRDGIGYQLTDQQVAPLRASGADTSTSAIQGLDLASWAVDPASQPPTTVDGEDVDRITGRADPVAAINAIVAMASQLGGDGSDLAIKDADAQQVRAAMTSSTFEVLQGSKDHLLRKLSATFEFARNGATASGGSGVVQVLAQLGRLVLHIELQIAKPNSDVAIRAPATVKPIDQLPKG